MKKIIPILLLCFISQEYARGQKISTKYLRPSITLAFVEPSSLQYEQKLEILKKISEIKPESRFNEHFIKYDNLKLDPPRAETLQKYIGKISNSIVAKWWNRNELGQFNYELIKERGLYTATDIDAQQAKASQTDRRELLGVQLLSKTYLLVYEINSFKKEPEYITVTERTSDGKTKKVEKRNPDEGYEASYTVSVYKLNFNDSTEAVFYNEYWTDKDNYDQNKAQKWNTATFDMPFITTHSASVTSKQPTDPNSNYYLLARRKTMNELFDDIPDYIHSSSFSFLNETLDDFKLKSSLFSTKPPTAKLGKKEGLYLDQRFFAYEIGINNNGEQQKYRKGVLRVKKISDNEGVATGNTTPSTFRQQGGKKLYEGMFLESKEDIGLILSPTYSFNTQDKSIVGISLGIDYRISRISTIRNFYIGAFGTVHLLSKETSPEIKINGTTTIMQNTKVSATSFSVDGNFSKEVYFTTKGNIYLLLSIGFGYTQLTFSDIGDKSLSDYLKDRKDLVEKDFTWKSYYIPAGIGLGINISPTFSLFGKINVITKLPYSTDSDKSITSNPNETTSWSLDKNNKTNISFPLFVGIRIRI
ncbi:MAG: hypothetical protein QM536_09025 [Chitinophagaceae bacterium]|nr:hypothetical protein [Chitinophagaceae bacterium]